MHPQIGRLAAVIRNAEQGFLRQFSRNIVIILFTFVMYEGQLSIGGHPGVTTGSQRQ